MKTTQIGEGSSGLILGHSMEEKSSQTPIYKQRKYSSSELVFCLHPLLFCYSSNIFSQSSRKCQKTTPPCSGLKNNQFQEPNATVKAAECFSNLPHEAFNCGFAYILTWSNSYSAKKHHHLHRKIHVIGIHMLKSLISSLSNQLFQALEKLETCLFEHQLLISAHVGFRARRGEKSPLL